MTRRFVTDVDGLRREVMGRTALRDLPWRRTRDPWAVLVAEAMLQQTQVARVVPRWHAFLGRFPDASPTHPVSPLAHVAELAIASLQGVLARTRAHAIALAKHYPDAIVPRDGESAEERVKRLRMVELKLVQSQQELLEPRVVYQAVGF